jgi:hypothetical protein
MNAAFSTQIDIEINFACGCLGAMPEPKLPSIQ